MTERARIFATQPIDDYCATVLGRHGQIAFATDTTEAGMVRDIGDAVALIVRGPAPITARVMDAAPGLRVIGRTGVGYDKVDIAAATARSIAVVNTPVVGARAVGEAAIGFMLALCKRFAFWDRELKRGNWDSRYTDQGGDLDGQTLGIVGLGNIGAVVAVMAQPFAMTVIAHDPYVSPGHAAALGVELVPMDELMARADFVSLHCPQTEETRGMIDRRRLALMKPGSYLVNLARGGVIESLDLLDEMLGNGHLAGVALDVFDPAPPDVAHPLFARDNVIASPHAIATSAGAMKRIFRAMSDDMAAVLDGRRPRNIVNPEVLR